jgi:hypothetical protein
MEKTKKQLRLAGVPEHFNFPIHLGINKGLLDIDILWSDFSTGTGGMLQALEQKEVDAALILSEGAVKNLDKGFYDILGVYVESPLNWGLHCHPKAELIVDRESLPGLKYGISRLGSGSHLMAKVHAKTLGIELSEDQFVIVNNLPGAIEAFEANKIDLFLWEKFTTQPFVDAERLGRVGVYPSPWPCFVLVCHKDLPYTDRILLNTGIKNSLDAFFKLSNDAAVKQISDMYKLEVAQLNEWIKITKWAKLKPLKQEIVNLINEALSI